MDGWMDPGYGWLKRERGEIERKRGIEVNWCPIIISN